jgi:hypothetical protein
VTANLELPLGQTPISLIPHYIRHACHAIDAFPLPWSQSYAVGRDTVLRWKPEDGYDGAEADARYGTVYRARESSRVRELRLSAKSSGNDSLEVIEKTHFKQRHGYLSDLWSSSIKYTCETLFLLLKVGSVHSSQSDQRFAACLVVDLRVRESRRGRSFVLGGGATV